MGIETTKLELIEWLTHLEDENTIAYLKEMKDSTENNGDWWDDLSESQKASIKRGLKDVEAGKVTPHEEVKSRYGL